MPAYQFLSLSRGRIKNLIAAASARQLLLAAGAFGGATAFLVGAPHRERLVEAKLFRAVASQCMSTNIVSDVTSGMEVEAVEILTRTFTVEDPDGVDAIIANGNVIDAFASPDDLSDAQRKKFALRIEKEGLKGQDLHYRIIDRKKFQPDEVIVSGGSAWKSDGNILSSKVESPAAVFTAGNLLTPLECKEMIELGESLGLEQGDFIYKTGKGGYERMSTGARRFSSTILVMNADIAKKLTEALLRCKQLPLVLNDGRKFVGVRNSFLISRYVPGQYFAPHFDGRMLYVDEETGEKTLGAFTAVLYLTDNFTGGATHYLPGKDSEVADAVAVQAPRGSAVVHRVVTVMHAGGEVLSGTKYVMQFGLMYETPENEKNMDLLPLRWAV